MLGVAKKYEILGNSKIIVFFNDSKCVINRLIILVHIQHKINRLMLKMEFIFLSGQISIESDF